MNKPIEIKKGVPMPDKHKSASSAYYPVLKVMDVGDMIEVVGVRANISAVLYTFAGRFGKKFASRTITKNGAESTIGIWRLS